MNAKPSNKEWDVYVDGEYVGRVLESTEEYARCAALKEFCIPADSYFEVSCGGVQ